MMMMTGGVGATTLGFQAGRTFSQGLKIIEEKGLFLH